MFGINVEFAPKAYFKILALVHIFLFLAHNVGVFIEKLI